MVIRWLNPYGTDWHYAVNLPNGQVWITEELNKAIDLVAALGLDRQAISFVRH